MKQRKGDLRTDEQNPQRNGRVVQQVARGPGRLETSESGRLPEHGLAVMIRDGSKATFWYDTQAVARRRSIRNANRPLHRSSVRSE